MRKEFTITIIILILGVFIAVAAILFLPGGARQTTRSCTGSNSFFNGAYRECSVNIQTLDGKYVFPVLAGEANRWIYEVEFRISVDSGKITLNNGQEITPQNSPYTFSAEFSSRQITGVGLRATGTAEGVSYYSKAESKKPVGTE